MYANVARAEEGEYGEGNRDYIRCGDVLWGQSVKLMV